MNAFNRAAERNLRYGKQVGRGECFPASEHPLLTGAAIAEAVTAIVLNQPIEAAAWRTPVGPGHFDVEVVPFADSEIDAAEPAELLRRARCGAEQAIES